MARGWNDLEDLRGMLAELLEVAHPGQVARLFLSLEGDTLTLTGQVGSERCRADAKRFALSFDGVFKVRNDVVVAAFLVAATDDEYLGSFFERRKPETGSRTPTRRAPAGPGRSRSTPSSVQASRDDQEDVKVERFPSVVRHGRLAPDRVVELVVDLSTASSDGSSPIALGRFPRDWDVIPISVQLFAVWAAEIEVLEQTVLVHPDGSSRPARFRCLVRGDHSSGAQARVQVSYQHGTRVCGSLEADVADGPSRPAATTHEKQRAVPTSAVMIDPEAVGPTLSISIFRNGRGRQTWQWSAQVPGGTANDGAELDLEGEDAAFAAALLASCPSLTDERFRRYMAGVGERLWQVAPAPFRTAYLSWREILPTGFPIQFVSDDPHVPWELMKPDVLGVDHLFLEHPVARWPMKRTRPRRQRLPGGSVLSFVPGYAPGRTLSGAQAEGAWVAAELDGTTMPATRAAMLDVLDGTWGGPVGVIHFAGHGRADTGLSDGGIVLEDDLLGVSEVDQSTTTLGERDGTLIVLNACETGAGARLLGMNTGWGAAIAARGFGGLVAPLWEVDDDVALDMARAALPPLLSGRVRLGEALRAARAGQADRSVSAFAYLAHGDVMARLPTRR